MLVTDDLSIMLPEKGPLWAHSLCLLDEDHG